jgi:hypothetical protein
MLELGNEREINAEYILTDSVLVIAVGLMLWLVVKNCCKPQEVFESMSILDVNGCMSKYISITLSMHVEPNVPELS